MTIQQTQDYLLNLASYVHNNAYYYASSAFLNSFIIYQTIFSKNPWNTAARFGATFLVHESTDILAKNGAITPQKKAIIDNAANYMTLSADSTLKGQLSSFTHSSSLLTGAVKKGLPLVGHYYVIGGIDQDIEWLTAKKPEDIPNDSKGINYAGKQTLAQPYKFALQTDTITSPASAIQTCLVGASSYWVKSLSTSDQRAKFLGTSNPEEHSIRATLFGTPSPRKEALTKTKEMLNYIIDYSHFPFAKKDAMKAEIKAIKGTLDKNTTEVFIASFQENLAKGMAKLELSSEEIHILQHNAQSILSTLAERQPGNEDYIWEGVVTLFNEGIMGCVFGIEYSLARTSGAEMLIIPTLRAGEEAVRVQIMQRFFDSYYNKQFDVPCVDHSDLIHYNEPFNVSCLAYNGGLHYNTLNQELSSTENITIIEQ